MRLEEFNIKLGRVNTTSADSINVAVSVTREYMVPVKHFKWWKRRVAEPYALLPCIEVVSANGFSDDRLKAHPSNTGVHWIVGQVRKLEQSRFHMTSLVRDNDPKYSRRITESKLYTPGHRYGIFMEQYNIFGLKTALVSDSKKMYVYENVQDIWPDKTFEEIRHIILTNIQNALIDHIAKVDVEQDEKIFTIYNPSGPLTELEDYHYVKAN